MKKNSSRLTGKVIYFIFTALILFFTVLIYVKSPIQSHLKELKKNDVWFGDKWYYADSSGNIIDDIPVHDMFKYYLRLKSDNGKVIITKTADFTPDVDEYLCFRARAMDVVVYVNDSVLYENHYKQEYRPYAERMYMLHQMPASTIRKGDKITIEMYNGTFDGYSTFQYIAMGDRYALNSYIIRESSGSLIICLIAVFIIVINIVAAHSHILVDKVHDVRSLNWLSLFLALAVIYLATDCGCMELFIQRSSFINWLNSVSLMILPAPFILFTKYAFFPGHKRYDVLSYINMAMVTISIICFAAFGHHMSNFFIFVHIGIGFDIIACVLSFLQEKIIPTVEVVIGFAFIIVTALASVFSYWFGIIYPSSIIFGYGLLVFSMCMLIWIVRSRYDIKRMREEVDHALMQREKKAAEEASEQKSRFLSHMSHEIRTPLNAILGMNELIMRETQNESIRQYADNIHSAGRTLLALINDVLDFSKIETGKMDIVDSDYSLSSVLNDIVLMIQGRANDKGLKLELDIDNEIPDILYGDETRIKQIMLNLMANAVKYTNEGYILLYVKKHPIAGYNDDENIMLEIRVSDSGIGIKKEEMPKIFTEFERVDKQRNRSIEGTGLGLSITSRLVSLMNGKISVESEYGKGSTFIVKIPQRVVSSTPIGDYTKRFEILSNNELAHEEADIPKFPGKKVFVVDDNEMNLDVIVSILEMLEISVERSNSGKSAIELLNNKKYDLILTDDMMPEINGTDLMMYLHEHTESVSHNTPIVVLTANAITGAREEYIRKGFDGYMTKPIDIDVLQKILMKYLK